MTNIPGFGAPLTATYSGYLSAGAGKHLHYLMYSSQGSPSSDPVVLWMNGGPGCSSLEGAFAENGPLWVAPGGASLVVNNYSVNTFATQIFLEAPICVGFSYEDSGACASSDTSTAEDNLNALISFFAAFPELAANDFWISGESYAGIYIPTLAYNVVQYNAKGSGPRINLKGILVGNGCLGNDVGICGNGGYGDYLSYLQLYGHGFVRDADWRNILSLCGDFSNESPACQNALGDAGNAVGNINVYYLYDGIYRSCAYGPLDAPRNGSGKAIARRPIRSGSLASRMLQDLPCNTDADLETYLNTPAVQTALHVKSTSWAICSNIFYTSDQPDERAVIYPALIEGAGLRVLIYNGDADACVPHTDNEWWTQSMNYTVNTPWTAWNSESTIGGYYVSYRDGNFTYASVRGAGHMVPQTQPIAALTLFQTWITGQQWP